MAVSERVERSKMNAIVGLFGQMFSYLLSFVIRSVFIYTLGELYLGLNGLYSNILSVLNLSELGLGTAIVIELYRTLANKDEEKTRQYLQFYKKAYYVIGGFILICGLGMTPFLQYLIKDNTTLGEINYKFIFLFYLLDTVFSYFSFAYRLAVLQADQKNYKAGIITYGFKLTELIVQVITLFIFKNIYLYLIIPLVLNICKVIVQGVLIGKWYPFIKVKPNGKLTKEEVKNTGRNVFSVAFYKISGTVINSTDNILLSSFVSVLLAGYYSNYTILIAAVTQVLGNITGAFTASIGNLSIEEKENVEKRYNIFKTLSFLDFWIYGFSSACFIVLLAPFIRVWVGGGFILNTATEICIVFNFLIVGLQATISNHRAAYGLFYKGRYRPIFSILANLGLSILFVKILPADYAVVGVLLGTILSNIFISWWYDAYIVYKYAFDMSPKSYYGLFWLRILYVIIVCMGLKLLISIQSFTPVLAIIIYLLEVIIIYNCIFVLCFRKQREFQHLTGTLMQLLKKVIRRNKKGENG